MLLSAERLKKYHNEKRILENASFAIEAQDKIGVIGVNGTGKSTLLKILAGKEHYDSGRIIMKNGIRIHYLPQMPVFEKETIMEEMYHRNHMQESPVEEYEIRSILTKLGIFGFEQPIAALSGGQKKRVALACALITRCDLLLLDEPTNHLDHDMVEWLEGYLLKSHCAIFMVTHDRYFLDRICTRLIELHQGELYVHEGNYSDYLEAKEKRLELLKEQEHKRRQLYRKELEWVRAGVQARTTKSKSRLQRFEELRKKRYEEIEEHIQIDTVVSRLGKKTIELEQVGFGYGEKELFHDVTYHLLRRDRVGIIGANGCGKSTLLDLIAKEKTVKSGMIIYGETVRIGYFKQHDVEMDGEMRVIDYIKESGEVEVHDGSRLNASQILEQFLFDRNLQYAKIGRLSGGERRRLYLLKILIQAPNILLLDEPTNDLDIQTLSVLEDYLDAFEGAVIAVSHDRYFLDRVCDKVFVFQEDGTLKQYAGGYSDYLTKMQEGEEVQKCTRSVTKRWKDVQAPRFTSAEKKEFAEIDDRLAEAEGKIAAVDQQMETAGDAFALLHELSVKREQLEQELEALTQRWMYLQEKAQEIQEYRNGRQESNRDDSQ